MCGIVGIGRRIAYTFPKESETTKMVDAFKHMLVAAQDRGRDATGVLVGATDKAINTGATPKHEGKEYIGYGMVKDHVPAEDFIHGEKFGKIMSTVAARTHVLIGHTRAATGASPMDNHNNHPHAAGNIVGVHNGYIRNWRALAVRHSLQMQGKCDSEVIFALLNKFIGDGYNYKEAVTKTTDELEGNYAVVFVDVRRPNIIGFMRHGAPMYIMASGFPAYFMFGSRIEYLLSAFRHAKLVPETVAEYVKMNQYVLDDGKAVVFDLTKGTTDDWIAKVPSFDI